MDLLCNIKNKIKSEHRSVCRQNLGDILTLPGPPRLAQENSIIFMATIFPSDLGQDLSTVNFLPHPFEQTKPSGAKIFSREQSSSLNNLGGCGEMF